MTDEQYMENLVAIAQDFSKHDQLFIICFQIRQYPELGSTQSFLEWMYGVADWDGDLVSKTSWEVTFEMNRLGIENQSRKQNKQRGVQHA
jgi:hypothetical protein